MRISNPDVARVLSLVGDLLEIKGGDEAAKAAAYHRAARSVEHYPVDVATLHREGRLREIPGVGEALAKKISELIETGSLAYYDRLAAEVPPGVLEMTRIPGVGGKTAGLLHRELGLTGVDELEEAVRSGALRRLPGLGPKKEGAILRGIAAVRHRPEGLPLSVARPAALSLAGDLAGLPGVVRAEPAGEVRRWCEWVKAVEVVAAAEDPAAVVAAVRRLPGVREVVEAAGEPGGGLAVTVLQSTGPAVDVRLVPPGLFPAVLHHRTGSVGHLAALGRRAESRGLLLGPGGLGAPGEEPLSVKSEADLYRHLGLPFIPSELREGAGEIEAAGEGRLPRLVELSDIRGDLHVHSDWSDGTASLEELARAGQLLGYEYLAVTDHSRSLAMARGLDERRLLTQKEAIERINQDLEGFRLLAGVEVDILDGGELDLPDSVLAEMDLVIASVHSRLGQPGDRMTARLLAAVENPHVDILGHPSGRLIGRREASALDIDAVLEAAARTGALLELNSSPERLDLKDVHARSARDKGCRVALGTDAHSPRYLGDMVYGVATARRAWLEPQDLANTRPWPELSRLLRRA